MGQNTKSAITYGEWSIPMHNQECDRLVPQHLPEYYKILQDDLCTYLCPYGSQRRAPNWIKNCQSRLVVDLGPGLQKHFLQMQVLLQHRISGKGQPKDFPTLQTQKGHMVDGSLSWTLYHFKWGADTTWRYKRTLAGKHIRGNLGKHGATDRRTNSGSFCSNIGKLGKILGGIHSKSTYYSLTRIFRMEVGHKKVFRGNHCPTRIRRA